jgi:protein-S-isoprenylcysteine O-methyltransferase Ste14
MYTSDKCGNINQLRQRIQGAFMAPKDHPNMGSSSGGGWLLAGYAGAAGFFLQELFLRRPGAASSLNASNDDEGTTRALLTSSGLAYGLPLMLRQLPLPMMPSATAAVGLIMQACGLALRVWSMRTLGDFYTRTLRTRQDQPVVDSGPYRMIRHPGYTGALLVWIGLALASRSAPATVLVAGLMGRAYQRRIAAEEDLLQRALPEYGDYSRRTRKILPFIW